LERKKEVMSAYQTNAGQPIEFNSRNTQEIVAAAHAARNEKLAELASAVVARFGTGVKALIGRFAEARKRQAAIYRLAAMDDRMLHDIGLSRGDISLAVGGAGSGYAPRLAGFEPSGAYANENAHRHAA
jgi:uncharacterized protein YjiS (DUF1127 family)